MTPQIQNWVRASKLEYISNSGRVLEIGSKDINGTVRQYFNDAYEYIGIDMEEGNNVDIVLDSHSIGFDNRVSGLFDIIICLETLEHDNDFFCTLQNIKYSLRKNGFFFLSTPTFGFPLHRFPKDYWRFGEDAYREILMDGYKILNLSHVVDTANNPGICCLGQKL